MGKKYALHRQHAADVFEAFRQAVMLSGDVPALAARMGLRPGTLYNKAEAGDDTHNQPTLRDVVLVSQITGDMRVVDALAATFGRATFDTSGLATASDEELLTLLADMGTETGEFHTALAQGLRQQRFTLQAMAHIRREAMDIVSALMTVLHRLEDYVDDTGTATTQEPNRARG
jgi:hypothetical protein